MAVYRFLKQVGRTTAESSSAARKMRDIDVFGGPTEDEERARAEPAVGPDLHRMKVRAADPEPSAIQLRRERSLDQRAEEIQRIAAEGVSGQGAQLPYREQIQSVFGESRDLSPVLAYIGGPAARAARDIGAVAYTYGEKIAFQQAPDLGLSAHEAAHVIQQRGGAQPPRGVGQAGDRYEQQADAVAGRVVDGKPAGALFDATKGGRGAVSVQRTPAPTPSASPERKLVERMIAKGRKDEVALTNAVFRSRHPAMAGKRLAKGSALSEEWTTIRDEVVRPILEAASASSATAAPPGPAAPSDPATPVITVPATSGGAPAAAQNSVDVAAGEARFHTGSATVPGSTIEIANTRAEKGDANTSYRLSPDLAPSLTSGDPDATTFYCSGLSIWTLAAAGYDVKKPLVGEDGVPYTWTKVVERRDRHGRKVEREIEVPVTLKQIIDGEPPAVEAMTIAKKRGMKNGGSVGRLQGEGHSIGHDAAGAVAAVKGAAGAFELAQIGKEIPEKEQKPGDFAQSRYESRGKEPGDDELKHRGAGHAWQVWSVRAHGSAMFGKPGSPRPTQGGLTGWHDDVNFVIDKDTEPALVGEHVVVSERRIEANVAGAPGLASKRAGGDGGVHLTRDKPVPETGGSESGYALYYGRLGSSRWYNWTPASKQP